MAKQAKVWTGSAWADLASATTDLTPYSTTAQMNTAIDNAKGLTLINTTSFTTAATASVNNCFTSDYSNYKILFVGVNSANTSMYMRMRNSGTDNTGSNYDYQYIVANATTISGNRDTNMTSFFLGNNFVTSQDTNFDITMYSPQLARNTTWFSNSFTPATVQAYLQIHGGVFDTTTQFDGFTLFPGTGTLTGTISVYGYKK